MGGHPPLGYDVVGRKLVVNGAEAATVRHIFSRYLALGTGTALLEELREQGFRTKQRFREGKLVQGGLSFTRGMLFHLMKNRIYVGLIVHKDEAYPGEHAAIVDAPLFEAVQQRIAEVSIARRSTSNNPLPSLPTGLVKDGLGRRMTPSHARKGAKRYHYYITAADLETLVIARLRQLLGDRDAIRKLIPGVSPSATELMVTLEKVVELAAVLGTNEGRTTLLRKIVREVRVQESSVGLTLDRSVILKRLGAPP